MYVIYLNFTIIFLSLYLCYVIFIVVNDVELVLRKHCFLFIRGVRTRLEDLLLQMATRKERA